MLGRRDRQTPVEGMVEVVDDGRNLVSSLDEIEVVVVEPGRAVKSRWRCLMTMEASVVDGGGWSKKRRWTRVDGDQVMVGVDRCGLRW